MIGESRIHMMGNDLAMPSEPIRRIAFVGNYLPRECGIATFTTDLATAFAAAYPHVNAMVLPMNDRVEGYEYPPEVRFEIPDRDLDAYRRAADFLNISNVDMVSLQHEFGIYGGADGDFILTLLKHLRAPVVATLHTVLEDPSPQQRRVMLEMARYCERFVVMSQNAVRYLIKVYGIDESRVDYIPHGIPDVPFVDPSFYKDQFGVESRRVLLTFGLLSPGKGIEYVVQALPKIVAKHPDTVYLVVGATHPTIRAREGEKYRMALRQMAEGLGVSENLVFHDRFVSLDELISFIGAADLYVTPYTNRQQVTSGTLAYAVGAGKAVVSSPYLHAEELLADGRGAFVPFRDAEAIAKAVNDLMDDEVARNTMRKKAYQYARGMVWPAVVARYMDAFHTARLNRHVVLRRTPGTRPPELPDVRLDHLLAMTDDTAMYQHAYMTVPNLAEGYTLDDNARALIASVLLEDEPRTLSTHAEALQRRYLAFIRFCFDAKIGRFHNFVSYDRRWLDPIGSEDSHGRAIWALGTMVGRSHHASLRNVAAQLFTVAYPSMKEFAFPRAWAFGMLGVQEYLRTLSGDLEMKRLRLDFGQRLFDLYQKNSSPDWRWFEPSLSYANAKLPHALLMAGHWTGNTAWRDAALDALRWLVTQQTSPAGHFEAVGCASVWQKGEPKPKFDQQPIETHASCSAYLEAYRITQDGFWMKEAQKAFQWFLGRNHLNTSMYDSQTGGCRDGLHPDRCNENQGAESTLAYLLSLLEFRRFRQQTELLRESTNVGESSVAVRDVVAGPTSAGAIPA
jgi:glycosyltransferase involved in cell wall biosynthesis